MNILNVQSGSQFSKDLAGRCFSLNKIQHATFIPEVLERNVRGTSWGFERMCASRGPSWTPTTEEIRVRSPSNPPWSIPTLAGLSAGGIFITTGSYGKRCFISATTMSSSRARPSKRQRTFGAPTEDDDPAAQLSQGRYKNRVSTRSIGGSLPTLATCCARAFVKHLEKLSANQNAWEAVLGWLKLIPEQIVPKLFAMLKSAHPTLLRSEFIVCVSAHVERFWSGSASTRPFVL